MPDARATFAQDRDAIKQVMARHGIRRLIAFGSRARGDARDDSDLDLAVEIRSKNPLALLAAECDLEVVIQVPVYLVELPNPRLEPAIMKDGIQFAG